MWTYFRQTLWTWRDMLDESGFWPEGTLPKIACAATCTAAICYMAHQAPFTLGSLVAAALGYGLAVLAMLLFASVALGVFLGIRSRADQRSEEDPDVIEDILREERTRQLVAQYHVSGCSGMSGAEMQLLLSAKQLHLAAVSQRCTNGEGLFVNIPLKRGLEEQIADIGRAMQDKEHETPGREGPEHER